MSIHPSLKSKGKGKGQRSVLKRFERLKEMLEKEKWKEGESVFGLPKLKTVRWKVRKAKKETETDATSAEGDIKTAAGKTALGKKEKTSKK